MEQVAEAAILSWNWEPGVLLSLLLSAWVYVRGWRRLQALAPSKFPLWRLLCFLSGLVVLFLAICSPLDAFGNLLLQAHMVQHLMFMMLAPPLLLFGFPYLPFLLGLPRGFVSGVLGPFLSWGALKALGRFLTHPVVCFGLFVFSNIFWHAPPLYELALRFPLWHKIEHICFIATSLLFWWPIIQPWPSRAHWPRWAMIPYLLFADIQNTALSAFLSFYDRILYPTYATAPRVGGISALDDQAAAGAFMWVPGSIAFLIPAGLIALQFLKPNRLAPRPTEEVLRRPPPLPPARPFDLLRVPLIGRLLRTRAFRRTLQTSLLLLAVLIMVDGWFGPQFGPMNLAGILPWTHWRGFTVLALLVAGNFFCMACPFTLARDLARRVLPARWNWPSWLRTKWIAVGLLVIYLWAYEAFGLWNSPWLTAWVIAGYFLAAVLVDGFFKNASFCKYICPIGQFHFVQSLNSPLQIQVREPAACASCRTYDCIRGNEAGDRGCELRLFQPRKQGNMDCTFCLDCVHACPKENVGLIASPPWRDTASDPQRSGVGKYSNRLDLAVLILVLTFGAFANAAGMVTPVLQWEDRMKTAWGFSSTFPVVTLFYILALLVVPLIAVFLAVGSSICFGRLREKWKRVLSHFAVSLAPVGFGMWLAHFLFHLFTGSHTFIPAFQRIFSDVGLPLLGAPNWAIRSWAFPSLLGLELLMLDLGFLVSLFVAWKRAALFSKHPEASRFGAFFSWGVLILLLYLLGIWIFFQPMDMRGTMMG